MARSAAGEEPAFEALAREVRRLFHRLRAAAEELHGDPLLSAAHRAILESLYRDGPQTVPALARVRPVSRQHVQVLANHLLHHGLVQAIANPAHRRSALLQLTPEGRRRFEDMVRRERRAVGRSRLAVSDRELRAATATLRRVAESLAAEDWTRLRG